MSLFRHKVESPWLDRKLFQKKYTATDFRENRIYAHDIFMSLENKNHYHNTNALLFGSQDQINNFWKANLLQGNSNYVIPDHDGALYQEMKNHMESNGYVVYQLDLETATSGCVYNLWDYITEDADILSLANIAIPENTNTFTRLSQKMFLLIAFQLRMNQEPISFARITEIVKQMDRQSTPMVKSIKDFFVLNQAPVTKLYEYCIHWKKAEEINAVKYLLRKLEPLCTMEAAYAQAPYIDLQELRQRTKLALFVKYAQSEAPAGQLFFQALKKVLWEEHAQYTRVMVGIDDAHQNLHQLLLNAYKHGLSLIVSYERVVSFRRQYPDNWEAVVEGCDTHLVYPTECNETALFASRASGTTASKRNGRYEELITVPAVLNADEDEVFVFIRNEKPCRTKRYDTRNHPAIH